MANMYETLTGQERCPHCGVSYPSLSKVWSSGDPTPRGDGLPRQNWSAYRCTTCGGLIVVSGFPGVSDSKGEVFEVFPEVWSPDETIPELPSRYLSQAQQTLGSPDASVVMSGSAIDAMLKAKGLTDGSLFQRITTAVEQGVLTSDMAAWAHRVRLNSNNPRHADLSAAPTEAEEAKMSLEFAKAMADILYVLPSKMPSKPTDG